MRLEYYNGVAQVHAFTDLVVTTDKKELLYAAFAGYDTSVQAMKSACYSNKSESFYLYPTDDCPNILGGHRNLWIQVIGGFKGYLTKMNDLTHAEMVSKHCLGDSKTPVILAWDGDLVKAFAERLHETHPNPLLDDWMGYIFEELRQDDLIEACQVLATTDTTLQAARIVATEEDIERVVLNGFRSGALSMPEGEAGDAPIASCRTVTDYLTSYGRALAKNLEKLYVPRHMPGDPLDKRIYELKRKPYQAQADTIQGLALTLNERRTAICVGEMGTGKTFVSLGVDHLKGVKEVLVLCPGHLTKKWKREIEDTIPEAEVFLIANYTDVFRMKEILDTPSDHPRYYVLSKDTAKLGFFKRRAVRWNERKGGWVCPDCGQVQIDPKTETPLAYEDFEVETAKNGKCFHCGTRLWTADNAYVHRVAPADLIKKYLKGRFDLFIADEVHQFKGDSAQGNAFGAFVDVAKKTLALTGTLLGGYASNLYRILFRLNPKAFLAKGMDFHSIGQFVAEYGVLEKVYKDNDEAKNRASKGSKRQVSVRERPGISPRVFGEFLLDSCAFLQLSDVSDALPSYTEKVELIEMDPELEDAYGAIENVLRELVENSTRFGGRSRYLGTYLANLLSYPDKPFGNGPILEPGTEDELLTPADLDENILYGKEERLIEILREEKRQGRKCLVFASFTGKKKDVTPRLEKIIKDAGLKVAILRSSVSSAKREDWLADKVYRGVNVVIANAQLVETGLDCLDFPTIIFHQTGYNLFTLRQASRRSFRLGQTKPVRIYFFAYAGTLQEAAIRLMGAKMEASMAIEGRFSEEGLRMMGSGAGQDLGTALAKALVEGLNGVDSAEAIWGRMGYGTIASQEAAEVEPVTATVTSQDTYGGIKIVEVVRVANKRKARGTATAVTQLGWDFGFSQEA